MPKVCPFFELDMCILGLDCPMFHESRGGKGVATNTGARPKQKATPMSEASPKKATLILESSNKKSTPISEASNEKSTPILQASNKKSTPISEASIEKATPILQASNEKFTPISESSNEIKIIRNSSPMTRQVVDEPYSLENPEIEPNPKVQVGPHFESTRPDHDATRQDFIPPKSDSNSSRLNLDPDSSLHRQDSSKTQINVSPQPDLNTINQNSSEIQTNLIAPKPEFDSPRPDMNKAPKNFIHINPNLDATRPAFNFSRPNFNSLLPDCYPPRAKFLPPRPDFSVPPLNFKFPHPNVMPPRPRINCPRPNLVNSQQPRPDNATLSQLNMHPPGPNFISSRPDFKTEGVSPMAKAILNEIQVEPQKPLDDRGFEAFMDKYREALKKMDEWKTMASRERNEDPKLNGNSSSRLVSSNQGQNLVGCNGDSTLDLEKGNPTRDDLAQYEIQPPLRRPKQHVALQITSRFFCHQCKQDIEQVNNNLTCPMCLGDFLEESQSVERSSIQKQEKTAPTDIRTQTLEPIQKSLNPKENIEGFAFVPPPHLFQAFLKKEDKLVGLADSNPFLCLEDEDAVEGDFPDLDSPCKVPCVDQRIIDKQRKLRQISVNSNKSNPDNPVDEPDNSVHNDESGQSDEDQKKVDNRLSKAQKKRQRRASYRAQVKVRKEHDKEAKERRAQEKKQRKQIDADIKKAAAKMRIQTKMNRDNEIRQKSGE